MNVGMLLTNSAAKYPEVCALVDGDRRQSFAELEHRVSRLHGAMAGSGLRPGDRLGILFHNSMEFVETYFAAVRFGLLATPVNFRLVGAEMAQILNDSGCRALFHGPEFVETLAEVEGGLDALEFRVAPSGAGGARDYEDFLSSGEPLPASPHISEPDPCQLMYTSGTTGRPKGAVLTHRSVIWNLINTIHGREDKAGQVSIIVGPMYHTAALNNHLTIQISLGGTSVLIKKFEALKLLRIIQREKATLISGSPAMFNLLMNHPDAAGFDTSSVTKCTAGADKLPMETKRRLMEFFPNIRGIYDVYGCTEAAPCITILNERDSLRKDASVGQALPFLQARLVDENDQPVPAGATGEIVCKGPNVMQGYWRRPEETARVMRGGWLHTGDLAVMDEEGFYFIVDRKKDMIVSGGENIYPREVEEVLFAHPDIADAAVVGMPDRLWGESVRAFVALVPGASLDEQQVIDYCKKHLAGYKKPRRVDFVKEIPRNASGKALKKDLRVLPV